MKIEVGTIYMPKNGTKMNIYVEKIINDTVYITCQWLDGRLNSGSMFRNDFEEQFIPIYDEMDQ